MENYQIGMRCKRENREVTIRNYDVFLTRYTYREQPGIRKKTRSARMSPLPYCGKYEISQEGATPTFLSSCIKPEREGSLLGSPIVHGKKSFRRQDGFGMLKDSDTMVEKTFDARCKLVKLLTGTTLCRRLRTPRVKAI